MAGNRINRQGVIERVAEYDMFPTKKLAGEFVDDFFNFIKDAVIAGDQVSISGFGKFECFTRQDGTKTPKFRPYEAFKEAVKG